MTIEGTTFIHEGLGTYTLTFAGDNNFDISKGYGAGSGTFTSDTITFANGAIYKKQVPTPPHMSLILKSVMAGTNSAGPEAPCPDASPPCPGASHGTTWW